MNPCKCQVNYRLVRHFVAFWPLRDGCTLYMWHNNNNNSFDSLRKIQEERKSGRQRDRRSDWLKATSKQCGMNNLMYEHFRLKTFWQRSTNVGKFIAQINIDTLIIRSVCPSKPALSACRFALLSVTWLGIYEQRKKFY